MITLIAGATILTQNSSREVIPRGNILIDNSRIVGVGSRALTVRPDRLIRADGHWAAPGFVNAHVHLGETAYAPFLSGRRTLGEYLRQTDRLAKRFPVEESRGVISRFSLLSMLRCGTTFVAGGRTAPAAESLGVRNLSGYMLMRSAKLGRFIGRFRDDFRALMGSEAPPLTSHAIFIHSLTAIDKKILREASLTFSENERARLMVHVAEDSRTSSRVRKKRKTREIDILEAAGLLDRRTMVIHGNHLSFADLRKIRRAGSSIIHCLSSNMNVADSTLDLRSALRLGVNVALATDGAVTGSDFSVLREASKAYAYHNMFGHRPTVSAGTIYDMVTVNAARALGQEDEVGSIEVGKQADIVILKPPFTTFGPDPVSELITYADLVGVRDVMIAGKTLIFDTKPTTRDARRIDSNFHGFVSRIVADGS